MIHLRSHSNGIESTCIGRIRLCNGFEICLWILSDRRQLSGAFFIFKLVWPRYDDFVWLVLSISLNIKAILIDQTIIFLSGRYEAFFIGLFGFIVHVWICYLGCNLLFCCVESTG